MVDPQQYLDFVVSALRQFNPSQVSRPSRQPDGTLAPPPEAQCGAEFYRACHSYSGGSILPSPEWGLKIKRKGAIDFFLPGYDLAVKLTQEGCQLGEHYERFLPGGCYNDWLTGGFVRNFILLDFRVGAPTIPHDSIASFPSFRVGTDLHPDMKCLYHVCFSSDFRNVSLLDSGLRTVTHFTLLEA